MAAVQALREAPLDNDLAVVSELEAQLASNEHATSAPTPDDAITAGTGVMAAALEIASRSDAAQVEAWGDLHVSQFLRDIDFGRYAEYFEESMVNGQTLRAMHRDRQAARQRTWWPLAGILVDSGFRPRSAGGKPWILDSGLRGASWTVLDSGFRPFPA